MRLFRRGGEGPWYAWWYGPDGARHQRSTKQLDRKAAEAVAREWERESADPAVAAANKTTVETALTAFVAHVREEAHAGHGSLATADFYAKKSGHPLRILGSDTPLAKIDAAAMDGYVTQRRGEGASEHTLAKELTTVRQALDLARRRGKYTLDPAVVVPKVSARYVPVERWLTVDEVKRLLGTLTPDHGAQVAWMVAVGGDWSAVARARRSDVTGGGQYVRVRGSKRETRDRVVPLVLDASRELLEFALEHAEGKGDVLFTPWQNVGRDIKAACARVGIDDCSPNDFRRSLGHWLRAAGVPPHLIAQVLGHSTSAMAERVYARPSAAVLGELLAHHALAAGVSAGVSPAAAPTAAAGAAPAAVPVGVCPPSASADCSNSAAAAADSADGLDASRQGEKAKDPANLLGPGCRRWDLNLRPWDYDSPAKVGIAGVLPAIRHKRGVRSADVQQPPVVLRVVRAGGRKR